MAAQDVVNGKVEETFIGYEGHGILTACIVIRRDSGTQSFGNYQLERPFREDTKRRRAIAFGMEFIRQTIKTVGVDSWEELPGRPCRVVLEGGSITGIGHYFEDRWFIPADLAKEMEAEEAARAQ